MWRQEKILDLVLVWRSKAGGQWEVQCGCWPVDSLADVVLSNHCGDVSVDNSIRDGRDGSLSSNIEHVAHGEDSIKLVKS